MSTVKERIAITGAGVVCGAGLTVSEVWNALREGRSAVAPIRQWDASAWPTRVAAELVGVDNRTLVEDRKLHKTISRTDLFGLYAARRAIEESGVLTVRSALNESAAGEYSDRSGVFAGSGGGAYGSNYDFFPLLTAGGGDLRAFGRELAATVNPMWLLKHLPNNVLCHVGIRHGFKGTNACITNHCVSGMLAVAEAAAALHADEADRAVAVGHDAPIEPETVLHYAQAGLLAGDALRPFSAERDGTVLGEGAGAVLLERLADAKQRGATVLGEYLGSGCCNEAMGVLELRPDGDGLARAIRLALEDAAISAGDVGMIVAHGNGTQISDASEALAIGEVFSHHPPPITAFKWAFGHLIAASGALDLVLALQALRAQEVPGIATLTAPDSAFAALPISRTSQRPRSDIALVLCRGFGSLNVATVVRANVPSPS